MAAMGLADGGGMLGMFGAGAAGYDDAGYGAAAEARLGLEPESATDRALREQRGDASDADDALIKRIERCWKEADSASGDWRAEARLAYDFFAGKQWSAEDKATLAEQLRPEIAFNRIGPVIAAVRGTEVQGRTETRYVARETADIGLNELLTNAAKFVRDGCDAGDEESDAFGDLAIAGMAWLETRMDYERDLDGMICIDRVDPLEMWWDPGATKRNLDDARWVMRIRRLELADIVARWPAKTKDLDEGDSLADGAPWSQAVDRIETEPHDADRARFYEKSATDSKDARAGKLTVAHYQWWERERVWKVADPMSGQVAHLTDAQYRVALARLALATHGQLRLHGVPLQRRIWKQAFVCGDTVLENGDGPSQEGFTLRPMTGERDRNARQWYGLVRGMIDPQRWANKWLSQLLHIVNSNAKGGVTIETDAVASPAQFEDSWADPQRPTWLLPGGTAKVKSKPAATYPQGIAELIQLAISSIRDVSGVSVELLGLANRDQPGILEEQRKQAGMTILATLFDALRRYRKEQGRVLLDFIRRYISDGRLIRIDGELGPRYAPLVRDATAVRYDVIVGEQSQTASQRERVFGVLAQLLPQLMKVGMPIPPSIVDYFPVPEHLQRDWKLMLSQPKRMSPQQALQLEELKAEIEKAKSAAALNMAKAGALEMGARLDQVTAVLDRLIGTAGAPQVAPAS